MIDEEALKRQVTEFIELNTSKTNRTNQNQSVLGSIDTVSAEDKPKSKFVVFKKSLSDKLIVSPDDDDEVLRFKAELGANLSNRRSKNERVKASSYNRISSQNSNSEGSVAEVRND